AEWLQHRIRRELRLGQDQGRRYSWGYPACPDLAGHATLFDILPTGDIGVALTEGFQLVPEQSTAAVVLHHPEARYFAVYAVSSVDGEQGAPEPALSADDGARCAEGSHARDPASGARPTGDVSG